jgi:O-antigen ligase
MCWLLPLPLFIYAMLETHSRGGVLGILAGGGAYAYSRYGGSKTLPFIVAGMLGILAVIGGRQGDMSGGGTAHDRLVAWGVGLATLFSEPLAIPTGLGIGWYANEYRMMAHNSFVQAYVELGLFGGGVFLGMFVLGARLVDRLGRGIDAPPWVVQARHYAFASLVGYAVGCFSLTRNFIVPTYLTIGIASVLLEQAAPMLPERFQVNEKWFSRGILFSICGLVFLKYTTQGLGMAGV